MVEDLDAIGVGANPFSYEKMGGEWVRASRQELDSSKRLLEISQSLLSGYGTQWNMHSILTLRRQSISRILYYNDLYKKILEVPGVICEFGVQWGATLSQLLAFRGIYEPYNHSRKICGFDTFEGFSAVSDRDRGFSSLGDYKVPAEHYELLEEILTIQESFSPLSHIRKWELVKGDASLTVGPWLKRNPHVIISMAIFDMDVYKPTKDVLNLILPRLTKGSLLVFDELCAEVFPGETQAVDEVLKINNISLKRHGNQPHCAWAVFGE